MGESIIEREIGTDQDAIGEVRLWQAVVLRTIQEWVSGPLRQQREAEQYLFHDNKDFPRVCESAGLDPDDLRARLARIRSRQSHQTEALAA
jgi:hypothetical protein